MTTYLLLTAFLFIGMATAQSDFRAMLGSNEAFIGVVVAIVFGASAIVAGIVVVIVCCIVRKRKSSMSNTQKARLKEKSVITNNNNNRSSLDRNEKVGAVSNGVRPIVLPGMEEQRGSSLSASHNSSSKQLFASSPHSLQRHPNGEIRTGGGSADATLVKSKEESSEMHKESSRQLYRSSSLLKPGSAYPPINGRYPGVAPSSKIDRNPPRENSQPTYFYSQTALNLDGSGKRDKAVAHPFVSTQPLDPLHYLKSDPALNGDFGKRSSYVERQLQHPRSHLISDQIFSVAQSASSLDRNVTRSVSVLPRTAYIPPGHHHSQPRELPRLDEKVVKRQAPRPPPASRVSAPVPGPIIHTRESRIARKTADRVDNSAAALPSPTPKSPRTISEADDGRSVTSQQLKQEAIQAFEFLDDYENDVFS